MVASRVMMGMVAGTMFVAGCLVVPALGAPDAPRRAMPPRAQIARTFFTPASADPKLAAMIARSGVDATKFRFAPADGRRGNRGVTIAVRSRSTLPGVTVGGNDGGVRPIAIAPIAYSLGASVSYKRLTVTGDTTKVDLGGAPGSGKSVDVGVSYAGRRASGRLQVRSEQPLPGADARLSRDLPSYSIDVGGSYTLTRNFDVTAGVRYKSQERDRLFRLTDGSARRDSQAVYVGTAFRF
ncbi:hypothetical protein [uncultured Sphingomonas sp.]|uniref:hypothetical protein n=1 Tax=uncultured Sphingomonas sp. TaxID=158754 RepID=UPI0035CC1D46